MKKLLFGWLIAAPFAMSQAWAAGILDQSFQSYGGYGSAGGQAQTFVVGKTGTLVRVEVALRPALDLLDLSATASAQLSIVSTVNGLPRALPGDILGSATAIFPQPGQELLQPSEPAFVQQFRWVPFHLSPIPVTAGDDLAIALSSVIPHEFQWACSFGGNGYASGDGYQGSADLAASIFKLTSINAPGDFLFRTYVITIPEPSLGSLLLPIALLGRVRRTGRRAPLASCQCEAGTRPALPSKANTL